MKLFKTMSVMKRFILVMFVSTILFTFILSMIGITIGYFFTFGIIEFLFGRYFIADLGIIFSPLLAFLFYLIFFDYPEEVLPIPSEWKERFKNHVPIVHIIDYKKNI